jgi:hypothetical protein
MLLYHEFERVAIVGWYEKYSVRIGKLAVGEGWRKARCIWVCHVGTGRDYKLAIGDSRMISWPHAMYRFTPILPRCCLAPRSSDVRLDRNISRNEALPGVAQ